MQLASYTDRHVLYAWTFHHADYIHAHKLYNEESKGGSKINFLVFNFRDLLARARWRRCAAITTPMSRVLSRRLSSPCKGFPSTPVCEGITFIVAYGKLVYVGEQLPCERKRRRSIRSCSPRPPIPVSAVRVRRLVTAESTMKLASHENYPLYGI